MPCLCRVDWVALATWVGALGTVGTLWSALHLLRRGREDRRRAQATRVSAWVDFAAAADADTTHIEVVVRNASEEPVYECAVYVHLGNGDPPGELGTFRVLSVVRPERDERIGEAIDHTFSEEAWVRGLYRARIVFTDAAGGHWERDFSGRLASHPEGWTE